MPDLIPVQMLYYDGRARATGEARLTPSTIVVELGTVTEGRKLLGQLPYRYSRKDGSLPQTTVSGWKLAPGELERINTDNPGL